MKQEDVFGLFGIGDIKDLPNAVEDVVLGDTRRRDEVYHRLMELNRYDFSYDWFQGIYEEELAQRKKNKQDFTPIEVAVLASRLTLRKGALHEPTAGTGSMVIADWWERCRSMLPFEFFPSQHMVYAWELSPRAIPILLLNLAIRGIMGYVYHGDVLENKVEQKYILLNRHDDPLAFSEVIKVGMGQIIRRGESC